MSTPAGRVILGQCYSTAAQQNQVNLETDLFQKSNLKSLWCYGSVWKNTNFLRDVDLFDRGSQIFGAFVQFLITKM